MGSRIEIDYLDNVDEFLMLADMRMEHIRIIF